MKSAIPVLNLIFTITVNALILWTWVKVLSDDGDTMFIGFFLFALFIITVCYTALTVWSIRLFKNRLDTTINRNTQNFVLFFINLISIFLVF